MRGRDRQTGFTLIELMVVITIILIIAAIAVPNLMQSRIPAHEASAIASIRAIHVAEMIYSSSHSQQGFAPDLAALGGSTEVGGRDIDRNLAGGRKSGYISPIRQATRWTEQFSPTRSGQSHSGQA